MMIILSYVTILILKVSENRDVFWQMIPTASEFKRYNANAGKLFSKPVQKLPKARNQRLAAVSLKPNSSLILALIAVFS